MESIVPPVLQVRKLARERHGQQPHDSVIFPASLPVSKPHHDWGMWQMPFIIFILMPSPKLPDCFLWPVRHATTQACPPLRLCGLFFAPAKTDHTVLLCVLPTHQPCPYPSVPCSSVTFSSQLKGQALPTRCPAAHLTALTSVFFFSPQRQSIALWHTWCASSHPWSTSKIHDFHIHHPQSPAWHVTGNQ